MHILIWTRNGRQTLEAPEQIEANTSRSDGGHTRVGEKVSYSGCQGAMIFSVTNINRNVEEVIWKNGDKE